MVMTLGEFERVAEAVTERTAELLCARVLVRDERGAVIASSEPGAVRLPPPPSDLDGADDYFRIPVRLGAQQGEVLVQPAVGEAISPRLAQSLVEWMIGQTTALARLANQHDLKDKFINDLLRGSPRDEADVLREAQILGMDLTRPRAVILVDAADYILESEGLGRLQPSEARTRRRVQTLIGTVVRFFHLPDETICAYIGDGEIAVLKASSTQDLEAWTDRDGAGDDWSPSWANLAALKRATSELLVRLRRETGAPISVSLGRYHPGIRGIAHSYQDARAALSLGRRFHGQNGVHCLDGLGVAAFVGVSDERTKLGLATHLLSPLDHEPELLQTVSTFFDENCCPSSAANRLSIHRNTLSYRLDKIAALTGLDPRQFDHGVQIRLALLVRSLTS
jgi:carbohydrate diacid regulator